MMYERNDVIVGVCHIPKHKRPSLVVGNEHSIKVVASFSGEESAEEYERYMRRLLKGLIEKAILFDKEQEHE